MASYVMYIGVDRIPLWVKGVILGYVVLAVVYVGDLLYRRVSNNHRLLSTETVSLSRLEKIMETSKGIRCLEVT